MHPMFGVSRGSRKIAAHIRKVHVLWGRSINGGLLGDKAFAKFYWLQKASEDVTAC